MKAKLISLTLLLALLTFSAFAFTKVFNYSHSSSITGEICAQIINEAHEQAGLKISFIHLPHLRTLMNANTGITDGVVCRIKRLSEQYTNLVSVGPAIIHIDSFAYSKNPKIKVENWQSLKPYKIGIRLGHKYAENGTSGMNILPVNSNSQLISMLEFNRVDVIVMLEHETQNTLKKYRGHIHKSAAMLSSTPLYFHLHKKNKAYISKLEKSIQQIVIRGRHKKIRDEVLSQNLTIHK